MGFLDIFKKNNSKKSNINIDESMNIEELEESLDNNSNTYDFINQENEVRDLIKLEILNFVKVKGNFKTLKERAEVAKENIGLENICLLKDYLSEIIEKPYEFNDKYKTDIEWKTAINNAALIIIYTFKEDAVEILSEVAYGTSDLNIKAINLLIKLFKDGVEQEKIIDDIMNNIVNFNDSEKILILGFMSQINNNDKVIAITQHFFKEFLNNEDVESAYEVLIHLINAAGRTTKGHLNFLKALSVEADNFELKNVMTLKDGDIEVVNIENLDEIVRIKSALAFYNFNSEDKEVNNNLKYWSENHKDKEVRDEIKRVMSINKG